MELVSRVLALSHQYNVAMICVLHENPSTAEGKTRGHLGSELNRKAFANLRIDKDSESRISTIYGLDMRKQEIPKEYGFCFAWDNELEMHTFRGISSALKTAEREQNTTQNYRLQRKSVFKRASEFKTFGNPASLNPAQAAEIWGELFDAINVSAVKKKMQRAETAGVITKERPGVWCLSGLGQSGQEGDDL